MKLFKVEKGKGRQGEMLKLIDTQYFNNRDGFGFVLSHLTKGDYQIHFKKYSTGFDVFDFTARIYADKMIKLIDDDDEHLKKVELSKEMMDKIPSIRDGDKRDRAKGKEGEERSKGDPNADPNGKPKDAKASEDTHVEEDENIKGKAD